MKACVYFVLNGIPHSWILIILNILVRMIPYIYQPTSVLNSANTFWLVPSCGRRHLSALRIGVGSNDVLGGKECAVTQGISTIVG